MFICASVTGLALTSITDGISRTSACRRSVRSNVVPDHQSYVLRPTRFQCETLKCILFDRPQSGSVSAGQKWSRWPTDRSPLTREKDRQQTARSLIIGSVPSKGVTRPIFNYKTPYLPFWPLHKSNKSKITSRRQILVHFPKYWRVTWWLERQISFLQSLQHTPTYNFVTRKKETARFSKKPEETDYTLCNSNCSKYLKTTDVTWMVKR